MGVLQIKARQDYRQKVVLAGEIRKALEHVMLDLRQVRVRAISDVPADGQWYNHIVFERPGQGLVGYIIKEGRLWRLNRVQTLLIADHISAWRVRRQKMTPDILEIQIEAKNSVSLVSHLKLRIRD